MVEIMERVTPQGKSDDLIIFQLEFSMLEFPGISKRLSNVIKVDSNEALWLVLVSFITLDTRWPMIRGYVNTMCQSSQQTS
jgi:hypothetical protein